MTNKPELDDNEINLRDFFAKIWSGRFFISIFVFLGLTLSLFYVFSASELYSSKISVMTPPGENSKNFDKLVFTRENFDLWKSESKDNILDFKEILPTKVSQNGHPFLKSDNEILLKVTKNNQTSQEFEVRTKDSHLINSIHNYFVFLNKKYTKDEISFSKISWKLTENMHKITYQCLVNTH